MAAIALATGVWAQIRSILHWIQGFIVSTRWVDYTTAATITSYLQLNGNRRSVREPAYTMNWRFVRPLKKDAYVVFEQMVSSGGVMWKGWRPLRLTKQKDAKGDDDENCKFTFDFVRGTLDWEKFLIEVALWKGSAEHVEYKEVRFKVTYHHGKTLGGEIARERSEKSRSPKTYNQGFDKTKGARLLGWKPEEIGGLAVSSSYASLALSEELLDVVDEIKMWRKSKKWYASRQIAWRHGYLLTGEPGTGKTTFVRATAEELDLPVHIFDLATMSNEDLRDAWTEMAADAPCIALIEDVDSIFHGRVNVATIGGMMSSGGLTFDALLNCIDGVERHDGVLLTVTTNHPEYVDPALANRSGRIDRIVEFKPLDLSARLKVAKTILDDDTEATRMAHSVGDVPASRFVEMCCKIALEKLYANRPKMTSVGPYR